MSPSFSTSRRLTQLDLLRARGTLRPPREYDIGFQDLVRCGEVHERAVLERFARMGMTSWTSARQRTRPGRPGKPSRAGPGSSTRGRSGVPLRPAPAERRDLTGQGPGHHRGQPGSHPGVLPDPAPDGPGERPVPGLGDAGLRRLPRATHPSVDEGLVQGLGEGVRHARLAVFAAEESAWLPRRRPRSRCCIMDRRQDRVRI